MNASPEKQKAVRRIAIAVGESSLPLGVLLDWSLPRLLAAEELVLAGVIEWRHNRMTRVATVPVDVVLRHSLALTLCFEGDD